jgi:hypothetical protein
VQGQRRCVGDAVVRQHGERGESDRRADVSGKHGETDDGAYRYLGAVGDAVARVDDVEGARQVPVPRHREGGPRYAENQREEGTECCHRGTEPHDWS